MKKGFYFVLLLSISCTQLLAQSKKTSLLWEISGHGLKQPSYLFGTFHIMCKADFAISDTLKKKIAGAKSFYGELNLEEPGMEAKLAMKMMMPDKSIETLIGKKDYKAVSEGFQKITGISLEMLDHFKPFMAESLLTLYMISCKEKIQPETEFVKIAKEYKIPVRGLETIDDQINTIDKQPLDSQIRSLTESILKYDSSRIMMKKMIAVYQARDIDSLYRFMKANGTGGDFEIELLVNRNHNWVPVMEKAMAIEPVFFAVGAGHLGGQEGVINLLRKRGYKLSPVKY
jgi:uncharacterized protein YbaP (TraB family)